MNIDEFIEVCPTGYSYNRKDFVNLIDHVLSKIPEDSRSSARFCVVQYSVPYSDDKQSDLRCVYQRPETDDELLVRQAKTKSDNTKQLIREKAEFDRLSKKFAN